MCMYFVLGITFFLIGLLVHHYKMYFLIAGYNTMTREQKEGVDIERLARLMGYYGYANAVVFFVAGGFLIEETSWGSVFPFLFLMVSTLWLVVRAQRFDPSAGPGAEGKKRWALKLIPIVLVLVGVGGLMIYSTRPIEVTLDETGIEIEGMYGEMFRWEELESVTLLTDLPKVILKTNGSALGPHHKGFFRVDGFGSVNLLVDERVTPFIYMKTDTQQVIFNLNSNLETVDLFQVLSDRVQP